MEITRVIESAWLHNLNKIFTEFINNPKLTLQDCYKRAAKSLSSNAIDGLNTHLYFSINALTFELLVLTMENFQKKGLDFGSPKISGLIRELKANLPPEYQTLNGAEFLKLVRQSISHNSNVKQNFKIDSFDQYKVLLNKKATNSASYQFSTMELLKILEIYDTSRVMNQTYGCISIKENYDNPNMLLYAKKKLRSFNNIIEYEDVSGNKIPMDKFQENAFQRFLIKHKHNINKFGKLEKFVARFYPAQDNKLNNYEYKSHLLMSTLNLFQSNKNVTCEDVLKHTKKNDFGALMHFIDSDFMQSILYSSIAFNVFSAHTPEELAPIFDSAQINCDADTIRHLRNSFIHGRYYYNYKDSFEIYDGANKLSHITTFGLKDIDKLYQTYSKQTQIEILNERNKYNKQK